MSEDNSSNINSFTKQLLEKKVKYTIESSMSIDLMMLPQQLVNHSKKTFVFRIKYIFYFLDLNIKQEKKVTDLKGKKMRKRKEGEVTCHMKRSVIT